MKSSMIRSFFGGMLVANSAPHLATAVSVHRYLSPLAGRNSGPETNAAWGALKLAGGLALTVRKRTRRSPERWDSNLPAFEAGYLLFAAWMTLAEHVKPVNWDRRRQRTR